MGFPGGTVAKESNPWDSKDTGLIPGSGRFPEIGNGTPLRYCCLEIFVNRGAWWATVHGVAKSWTRLSSWAHTHTLHLVKLVHQGPSHLQSHHLDCFFSRESPSCLLLCFHISGQTSSSKSPSPTVPSKGTALPRLSPLTLLIFTFHYLKLICFLSVMSCLPLCPRGESLFSLFTDVASVSGTGLANSGYLIFVVVCLLVGWSTLAVFEQLLTTLTLSAVEPNHWSYYGTSRCLAVTCKNTRNVEW